jgi:hypothetical protein
MDEGTRLLISAAITPLVAWFLWKKVARPHGRWIVEKIPHGWLRDALTKDRGGYL